METGGWRGWVHLAVHAETDRLLHRAVLSAFKQGVVSRARSRARARALYTCTPRARHAVRPLARRDHRERAPGRVVGRTTAVWPAGAQHSAVDCSL